MHFLMNMGPAPAGWLMVSGHDDGCIVDDACQLVLVLRQGAYHIETARNELIKLPVFEIKCKAMMGICIYWISRHVIFGKRCKTVP